MAWWGKLLGGAFGFVMGGPLGALLGVALGHNVDRGVASLEFSQERLSSADLERIQLAFFSATFSVMGYLAKADGRVSPEEIKVAQSIMARMELGAEMRETAMRLFQEGKAPEFPLEDVLVQFRRECHRRTSLFRMFIEIQLEAAFADGALHPAEERVLQRIANILGFPRAELEWLKRMSGAGQHYSRTRRENAPAKAKLSLADAYAILNINPNTPDGEVKKAYRRLMNQHHPDKLVAKGLPEEMVKLANEKTHEIRRAYDRVREARGL